MKTGWQYSAAWLALFCLSSGAMEYQRDIPVIQRMTNTLNYAAIPDWKASARLYYQTVFDPAAQGRNLPVIETNGTDNYSFAFPSNLSPGRARKMPGGEFQSAGSAVLGAERIGIGLTDFNGTYDFRTGALQWFHPAEGVWRNYKPNRSNREIVHGLYDWLPLVIGAHLSDIYNDDARYVSNMLAQSATILRMAKTMGCPDNPDLTKAYYPDTDTAVPATDLGSNYQYHTYAPTLAWLLYMGYQITTNSDYLDCSKSAMEWYLNHPATYEGSSAMSPLVMARLNAECGWNGDMSRLLNIFLADVETLSVPRDNFRVYTSRNCRPGGVPLDALAGGNFLVDEETPDNSVHGWSATTYSYAGYIAPVARYDQRYARDIGRFLLNLAHSSRHYMGLGLDGEHQDHLPWRRGFTNGAGFVFSYEGIRTYPLMAYNDYTYSLRPATFGDGLIAAYSTNKPQFWIDKDTFEHESQNICIYMGNYIGFLGSAFNFARNEPGYEGLLKWDLTATDFYKQACYPTYLIYNPYPVQRSFVIENAETLAGSATADLYDEVSGVFLQKDVSGNRSVEIGAGQAMVLVITPGGGTQTVSGSKRMINGRVIDYRYNGNGLFAEYYNNTSFTNRVCARIDPQLNMSWGNGTSPDPAVNDDNFCVRWTGWVVPEYSETYTFKLADNIEGAKVWMDDVLVADDWDSMVRTNTFSAALKGNVPAKVRIDYRETTGHASVKLYWSSASRTEEIVPQSRLTPAPESAAEDSDGDGLPDVWESQYFGGITNANPSAFCANGFNTVREAYVSGVNPSDPNARFSINRPEAHNAIQWETIPGRVYNLYGTTNLMNGFELLESGLPWTANVFSNRLDSSGGSWFFKVGVQLQK